MRKKLFYLLLVLTATALATVFFCNRAVDRAAEGRLYTDVGAIPYRKVGLLLGTAKQLESGWENRYYTYRIEAAAALLKAGKIRYLVISGDNSRKDYDEPSLMRADLIAAGVDSARIFLDYAGFRTFDSMVRLHDVFGQDSVTVISQAFHNERALYIAGREGISAIGFNARDVGARSGLRVQARERLARVKLFLDYLMGTRPKFLGPKVVLPS
ncbi:SanA/YdcF family protein [Flaviaesturariibacter aridisoli]|uniref:Vancomycin high temperature exclusion protein n=1 Tax=Flaviaesturariibacter aridisoli TaxID=2545761 RepID=A0A4V2WLU6_9BACT|nr:ElyC/SanA/YdcF family protein [Flaviaesturariibacter aridisoli]TCZ64711.1 vancomycin high temperature exclusion protein [Flaviaesturariibacter aridisoli]